jgi:serine/threonine protein kinase
MYGQTLQEVIEFRRREFTELEVAEIMKQLFSAISYLHGNKITHKNIIPSNVMLDQNLNVTLIDFGLGRLTKKGMVINTKKDISQFTAPESYNGYYTDKSDVWSLGNLLYFIFAGKLPFSTDGAMDVFKKSAQRNLTFKSACWYDVSKEAKKLICQMMQGDPEKRPDHLALVSHTWFDAAERQEMMREIDKVDKEALEKLKGFKYKNDLQKIFVYMHVNMLLDDNDFLEYQAKFTQIDKNNDGFISRDELSHAFEVAGIPLDSDQLDAIIINLDFTGKRQMNFTEFL